MVQEELVRIAGRETVAKLKKGNARNVIIADGIRRTTDVPLVWIPAELATSTTSSVSQACRRKLKA